MTNGLPYDETKIVPDSSAPYPIIITPAGDIEPDTIVSQAYASAGVAITSGNQAVIPGTSQNIGPFGTNRLVNVTAVFDIRPPGVGFSFFSLGLIDSATHPFNGLTIAVAQHNSGDVGDYARFSVPGLATRSFLPAGDTMNIQLVVQNPGTPTVTVDVNTAWQALIVKL